ncbi:Uncharacterised protein [Segatella copri]|nr:Uncharacterised protein [Segatella copri]
MIVWVKNNFHVLGSLYSLTVHTDVRNLQLGICWSSQ